MGTARAPKPSLDVGDLSIAPPQNLTPLERTVSELLVERPHEGVWLIDAEAHVLFANRTTAQMLGMNPSDMVGRHVSAFMDEAGWKEASEGMKRRSEGISERFDARFVRADGSPLWVSLAVTPVYDRDGAFAGSLAVLIDISERRRAEQALRTRIAELERLLAGREEEIIAERFAAASIEARAYRDHLTGLHNRRYFEERIEEEVSRALRFEHRFCVLLLDLDRFASLNDAHGREAGDTLLRGLGAAFRAMPREEGESVPMVRSSDVLARVGPDEFGVIVCETELGGGVSLAERLAALVQRVKIPWRGGRTIGCTASIGVAAFPLHASTAAELWAAADQALQATRRQGVGRVGLADRR